jgi:hypothetical protein
LRQQWQDWQQWQHQQQQSRRQQWQQEKCALVLEVGKTRRRVFCQASPYALTPTFLLLLLLLLLL